MLGLINGSKPSSFILLTNGALRAYGYRLHEM
jgi:hypothetical protein